MAARRPWLKPALRLRSAAIALMAAFCLAALVGVPIGPGVQVGVLMGGMVLVGFSHGSLDHLIARPVLQHLGRYWCVPFGVGYVGLAGLVWLAWVLGRDDVGLIDACSARS